MIRHTPSFVGMHYSDDLIMLDVAFIEGRSPETRLARKLAVKNIADNAKVYAEAAGVSLGQIISISEEDAFYQPRYAPMATRMDFRQGSADRGGHRLAEPLASPVVYGHGSPQPEAAGGPARARPGDHGHAAS